MVHRIGDNMDKVKAYVKRIFKSINKPQMRILPGNVSFFFVLSIVPIITVIGVIASYFSISIDELVQFLEGALPKEVSEVLLPFIDGKGIDGNIIFYMLSGFLVASNGAHSLILASNTLYEIKDSDFITRRIRSLFLTIILVVLFFFVTVFLAFGNVILKLILDLGFLKNVSNFIYPIFLLCKWPVAFIFIYFIIKYVYVLLPDMKIKPATVKDGAIVTTIGWSILTAFYSYYVEHFTHYDIFYGSLSNIVVMMMWIYFLAYILMIGMAINADDYHMDKSVSYKNDKKVK